MSEYDVISDMKKWRAERPDEWKMDEFMRAVSKLQSRISDIEKEREIILNFVNEQAEDEGLWCVAQYASESYIQTALRRLHSVIESNLKRYKL